MIEENPRRRKRKNPSKKRARKSGRRKARKVAVSTVVRANPRRRSGRRRSNPAAMKSHRRSGRRRRNPAGESWSAMGAQAAGGAIAFGAEYALSKVPQLSGYYYLAVDAALPIVLGIGAAYAKMPNVGRGMVGVGGYKLVKNGLAAYSQYSATKKLGEAAKKDGAKGLGSIRYLNQPAAVAQGFGSVRTARVRAR